MIRKPTWILLLFCLGINPGFAYERQFNLSTYYDSNPRENIENKQPVFGLKTKALVRFEKDNQTGRIYGSALGQGFFEPTLFWDSKVVLNAELGGYYNLLTGYRLYASLKTFEKLYFDDFQRSGRQTMSASIKHQKSLEMQEEIGLRRSTSRIDYGTLFKYADQRVFFNLTRQLSPDFLAELSTQRGRIDYEDYPARIIINDTLILNDTQDQQDITWFLGLHVKHLGRMIWGAALNFEDISSNSDIAESQIWSGKIYVSRRIWERVFFHVVLQGMKKSYGQKDIFEATPYRDPEENIQNQLHIQLERVLNPSRVLYIQYSTIKNETVFNHWFYTKNLVEAGVKLTL